MNDSRNLLNITGKHQSVTAQVNPVLDTWIADKTGHTLDVLRKNRGTGKQLIQELSTSLRNDLLDKLLTVDFISEIFPAIKSLPPDRQKAWLRQMSYAMRKLSPRLLIAIPSNPASAAYKTQIFGAITGSFAGVYASTFLNVASGNQLIAAMIMAPVGTLLFSSLLRWFSTLSPISKWLAPRQGSDPLFLEQARDNVRVAIRSWLEANIVLLLLIAGNIDTDQPEHVEAVEMPSGLLTALVKLSQAPEDRWLNLVNEVLQEFNNAGYSAELPQEKLLWNEGMRNEYEVLGIIHPGDECRILQQPVVQNNQVRRKGRLTRVR